MIIRINHVEVPFTLESEKNWGDLLSGLYQWLSEQKHSLVSILLDGKAAQTIDPLLPIHQIQLLELETVPLDCEYIDRLSTLDIYFALFEKTINQSAVSTRDDLEKEFPFLVHGIPLLLGPITSRIDAELSILSQSPWSQIPNLYDVVHKIHSTIKALRQEKENPEQCFYRSVTELAGILPQLKELSVWLQKGRDQQAMKSILLLLKVLEDLNRQGSHLPQDFFSPLGSEFSWNNFLGEINVFLLEIQNALKDKDFVLLSDLIEYEICPRLESITSYSDSLFSSLSQDPPL